MRILFVTGRVDCELGGPYRSVLDCAAAVAARGNEVTVVGTNRTGKNVHARAVSGMIIRSFSSIGPTSFHMSPSMMRWLHRSRATVFDAASIEMMWGVSSFVSASWCYNFGVPYMVSARGALNRGALRVHRMRKLIARPVTYRMLRRAAVLRALSESEMDRFHELGFRVPVCVVGNGVVLPETQHGHNGRTKTLLYLGRLHHIKRLDRLIKAWATIQEESRGWTLTLAGPEEGSCGRQLREIAGRCGVESRVRFLGPQRCAAKTALLKKAGGFVLCSDSEGVPMAALEAMSHGVPTLVTKACNLGSAARAHALLEVGSTQGEVRQGLIELLTLPAVAREALGERGKAYAAKECRWDEVASRLERCFAWMSTGGPAPPWVAV